MSIQRKRILVIAAHPDDEVLGCGATIAQYVRDGHDVYCLILGKGKSSRLEDEAEISREQAMLFEESKFAAKILGIKELSFESFPDQKYDAVPFADIVEKVRSAVVRIHPDVIFAHHPKDINKDHQIISEAALLAAKEYSIKEVYLFSIPGGVEWRGETAFFPNVFVDVKDTFEKKLEAMKSYKSELCEYPHPRSLRALEAQAQYWGGLSGKKLAEAFQLVSKI